MELTLLVLGVVVLACFLKLLSLSVGYFQKWILFRRIPSPKERSYPVLGHAMLLRGDPDDMYETIVKLSKDQFLPYNKEVWQFWMGPVPVVFIVGAKAAEVMLRSSENTRKSFFYTFLHSWLGTGLLTSDGMKWKTRRRLLTPTFHFSILQDFLEVMNEQANIFAKKLDAFADTDEVFNICDPVTLCALDIICETAMGKSIHAQENEDSEYVKALIRSSDIIQYRQKSPWLWWEYGFNHTEKGKTYSSCIDVLHGFTKSVIKDRKESFDPSEKSTKKKRLAFLDLLLTVSDNGDVLSFSDIQEEVDTFMFEGHDTTAAAMGWALHLIGSHPEVQRRIQEEVDEVFGENANKKINMENIKKLEYLEMCIKESLRLYPSVPFFGRNTTSDCVMDGNHVPVGTECIVVTQLVNMNENYWKDPERFDPERFSKDNSVGRHPYAYLPFSAGPRNCIGQRFALMEEKVMLAYLFRSFSLKSCDDTKDLKLMSDLILRSKSGIGMKITRRKQ